MICKFKLLVDVAFPNHQVIGFKDNVAICVNVHHGAIPVGMDLAGLLDDNIIQDTVGLAVLVLLQNGGVGQGLMIGQFHAVIVEVIAAAHPAAVHTRVVEQILQVVEDLVRFFLVQVFGGGVGVVKAELDRDAVGLEAIQVGLQVFLGIILIQHAVDTDGNSDPAENVIAAFGNVLDHMSGAVDAGDFVLVLLGEGYQVILGRTLEGGQRGIDEHPMGGGDLIEHGLQSVQVSEGLTAGEDEVTLGGDLIHGADGFTDLLQAEAYRVLIFLLVDTERAVVAAVIGDENRDGCAAFTGLVRIIGHRVMPTFHCLTSSLRSIPVLPANGGTALRTRAVHRPT